MESAGVITLNCKVKNEPENFRFSLKNVNTRDTIGILKKVFFERIHERAIGEITKLETGQGKTLDDKHKICEVLKNDDWVVAEIETKENSKGTVGFINKNADLKPLFEALRILVSPKGRWVESDISNNGGREGLNNGSLASGLHVRLRDPLIISEEILGKADYEMAINRFKSPSDIVSSLFTNKAGIRGAPIYSYHDIENFDKVCNGEFQKAAKRTMESKFTSSSLTTTFIPNFVSSIFQDFAAKSPASVSEKSVTYRQGQGWGIRLFPGEGEGDTLRYQPENDFSLSYSSSLLPCLIGEIASSEKTDEDRIRMIVQGIAVARAGKILVKASENGQKNFVLMAVYVSPKFVVSRYLLQVNQSDDKLVDMYKETYDLCKVEEAVNFLREMFSWRHCVTQVLAPKFEKGEKRLKDIDESMPKLKSFSTAGKNTNK